MTFVLYQQMGETNGMAEKRIARELMLQSRKRWCNPPLRKVVPVPHRLRARLVDLQGRLSRKVTSCGRRVYLRRWHEPHVRFASELRRWAS